MEYRIKMPCAKCRELHPFFISETPRLCPGCWEAWRKHQMELLKKQAEGSII